MYRIHDEITVYTPASGVNRLFQHIRDLVRDFRQAHSLGFRLFLRDLRGMYRASILGYFWSLAPALVTALIWIFLRGQRVVSFGDTGVAYPVYVLVSMMLWMMFQDSVITPLQATQKNQVLMNKVNFPRESILYSGFYMALFNSSLKIAIIFLVFLIFNITPTLSTVLGFVGMFILLLLGFAIGVWLTPMSLLYRDIQRRIPIALRLLMYLTPVIYVVPKHGMIAKIMNVNPIVPVLETARDWFLNTPVEYLQPFFFITIFMILFLCVGLILNKLAMPIVIERLGAGK